MSPKTLSRNSGIVAGVVFGGAAGGRVVVSAAGTSWSIWTGPGPGRSWGGSPQPGGPAAATSSAATARARGRR